MKRNYSKLLYNQRNKDETIMSVIKRLFGEHLMSRLTRTQNRELSFRCITYNMHRLTNLIILMMLSTEPLHYLVYEYTLIPPTTASMKIGMFLIRNGKWLYRDKI
jgi:hypothetical protein